MKTPSFLKKHREKFGITISILSILFVFYIFIQGYTHIPSPSKETLVPLLLNSGYMKYNQEDLSKGTTVNINFIYPKEAEIGHPDVKIFAAPIKATIESTFNGNTLVLKTDEISGQILAGFTDVISKKRPNGWSLTITKNRD